MSRRVGLVAEGGGTKAAYSAGALKCFLENGIYLPYCVGISLDRRYCYRMSQDKLIVWKLLVSMHLVKKK